MASSEQSQREVELEIAAFMGPHIKRARIMLVVIGILYLISGYMSWDDVNKLREMTRGFTAEDLKDPFAAEIKRLATLAYAVVIVVIIAGISNIVLAVVAGKKTMIAFYAAMGIFAVHSAFLLYVSGGAVLTNIIWWITAIVLGLGFQAALKADKLRKGAAPAL